METRDLILNKALKSFIKVGYEGTSISTIADECGFTKGALYHHFKNKEEIFYDCIELLYRDYEVWLERRIRESGDIRSFLKIFFECQDYFKNSEFVDGKMKHFYRLIFDAIDHFPDVRKKQMARYYGYLDRIKNELDKAKADGAVKPDIDSNAIALHVFVLFEGLMLLSSAAGKSVDFSGINETVYDSLWNMIRA